MRKILVLFIFLFTSIYLSANIRITSYFDAEKSDTLRITTVHYSKSLPDSSAYINIDYPQITGLENKVIEEKVNAYLKDEFSQSILWYDELISDTAGFSEDGYDYTYSFETGFEVQYNSVIFLSIILDHYQFTGGAHGNYFSTGYNIDMRNGKTLKLTDIINNDSFDLLSYECEQAILDTFQVGTLVEAGLFEDELVILPDQDFYIIPGALVLQFDPYEIAPYAMGEINVAIPFYKIKDILKPNLPFGIN